jgi:hypothetical protein
MEHWIAFPPMSLEHLKFPPKTWTWSPIWDACQANLEQVNLRLNRFEIWLIWLIWNYMKSPLNRFEIWYMILIEYQIIGCVLFILYKNYNYTWTSLEYFGVGEWIHSTLFQISLDEQCFSRTYSSPNKKVRQYPLTYGVSTSVSAI